MAVLISGISLLGCCISCKPIGEKKACENRDERIAYLGSLFCLIALSSYACQCIENGQTTRKFATKDYGILNPGGKSPCELY